MQNKIISYSLNFASFLITTIGKKINKIILYGSALTENFDKESDIDIFVETDIEKNKILHILELYKKTKEHEKFSSIIKNNISIKIGNLDKWSALKREIISNSLILYGKYQELPEDLKQFSLIKLSAKKIKLWRRIYGYQQKIGRKIYKSIGLLEKVEGKKLTQGVVLVPQENTNEFINFLRKNKIKYTIEEIWKEI